MLAARTSIIGDGSSNAQHELLGYDFMVDTDFNVWLIEVNSSPSMDSSSPVTEIMVKEVMTNLGCIVME